MRSRQRRNSPPETGVRTERLLPPRAPPPGVPFALPERYEDLGGLARGGWGEVRRVRDRVLDRVVAMKVLAREHLEAPMLLARFMNEARVTASLEHPGIVPVHDRGVLEDGRPWFTMKEVRGRTLHQLLRHDGETEAAPSLRRLVEILLRVAETVGYAHERGVLHRDLKPGNVMVGEFGEVLVLDWGIARAAPDEAPSDPRAQLAADAALTGTGEILGTVAYMSPEQGRGIGEPLTPSADVFSLGLMLFEVLSGERARPHDRVQAWAMAATGSVPKLVPSAKVPEELCSVVSRATTLSPGERLADGMAFAELLHAWLDGSMRRERAAALVAQASRSIEGLDGLRAERDRRRAEARRILADVRDSDPVERKRPAWALEDEARGIDQQIDLLESDHIETLRAALELDPDHDAAHLALAAIYRARVLDAEARRAPADVARAERRLRRHDRGDGARFLRGVGRLVLDSDPSGSPVRARRYVEHERRLLPDAPRELGRTPIDVELEAGSWLLEVEHRERVTRLPLRIVRDETWTLRPPLRCLPSLGEHEVHVPAGPAMVGGDEQAIEPVPARSVWIDDFVIQKVAVTVGDYLSFLDALEPARAEALAPRDAVGRLVERIDGAHRICRPGDSGEPVDLRWPITSIDWHAARAYAAWLAERTGLPWRLPDELEWEKAARGADGRFFPWGDFAEPTWARIIGATEGALCRVPVGSYPVDESPYGVLDLAGNARTWCANAWRLEGPPIVDGRLQRDGCDPADASLRAIRGGAWCSNVWLARSAGRFAGRPDECFGTVGVRLVRSV